MKKDKDIEKLLMLLADLEEFHPADDYITELIEEEKESELSADALDQVAAAYSEKAPALKDEKKRRR